MSSTPFGDRLKREREMRGVTIEEISAATRISTRFLDALENDQWERLPGGVFNRGFIRSIARFLGLDEDSLIAEYELETKEKAGAHAAASQPSQIPRNWRAATAIVIAIAIAAGTGWFAYRHYQLKIGTHPYRPMPALASTSNHAVSAAEPLAGSDQSASASAPDAADTLTLKLQAGKAADVKVTADDRIAFDGHIATGEVMYFSARDSFEITSSEAGGLLLELNGQTVPPLGGAGQPGSVTLTRKNLQSPAGGTH